MAKIIRDNGDDVALMMRKGSTPEEWLAIAAEFLGVEESELQDRYRDINENNGKFRMWLGNEMRHYPKRKKHEKERSGKL